MCWLVVSRGLLISASILHFVRTKNYTNMVKLKACLQGTLLTHTRVFCVWTVDQDHSDTHCTQCVLFEMFGNTNYCCHLRIWFHVLYNYHICERLKKADATQSYKRDIYTTSVGIGSTISARPVWILCMVLDSEHFKPSLWIVLTSMRMKM